MRRRYDTIVEEHLARDDEMLFLSGSRQIGKTVDFVVTKNGEAWFLVEVKLSNNSSISPHLNEFQQQTGTTYAFQVIINMPYVDKDCFSIHNPVIVPAKTFLSQLV